MMQEKHNIDELFKSKLGSFSEHPDDKVWAKVERQLRLKRLWKYAALFLLGISTIGIICTVHLLTKEKNTQTHDNPLSELNTNKLYTHDIPSNDAQINEFTPVTANNKTDVVQNTMDKKTLNSNKPTPENSYSKLSDTQHHTDFENNSTNNTTPNENKSPTTVEVTQTSDLPLTQKQKEALFENIKKNEDKIAEKIEAAIKTQENQNITEVGINDIKIEDKQEVNTQENTEIITENKTEDNNLEGSLNKESKQNDADSLMNVSEAVLAETQNKPFKPKFEVLFYTQPSYVTKSFKGLSNEDIQFRKENEKNFVYLNYGMELRCYISNFYLQTGIAQMQSGEKNNYEYPYIKSIDTSASHYDVSITSYPDPQNPGNTIIVFDSTWVSVSDSSFADMKLKNLNTIKYMEIPLNMGYVVNYDKHQWGISGGVSYALLSYASMAKIDKESHEIVLSNHNDTMLRKNLWSYNLGLAYGYSVSGNTRLFVQTAYKRNINSVFNSTSYKQYYNFIDMKIGVMMKF